MSNISYDIVHIMIHDQENSYCEWETLLNCNNKDRSTYKVLLSIAGIFDFFVFFLTSSFLFWRLYFHSNDKIWKIHKWTSINIITTWLAIYCLFRSLCSTVTVLDLFAGNMVIRSLIYKIGFIPGQLAIQIYLASIFRLIPKLSLSQSISSSFLPNKSEISNSKITTIWIPKGSQITKIFRFLSIYTLFGVTILLLIRGFDIDRNGDNKRARILLFCVDLIYECNNLFYVICFLFYGRISVNLAIKGIELAGINDINENSNQASQECQIIFKARIRRGLKNGNNGKKSIY
ncbi:14425_t:CDS:2 [Funneliformis geosporum]|uniref:14425_t:CDS:1 n=1 Tax=Funneliformis geosporum TaxID=1117311 RepID=A0A9W4SMC4_9GLOM|nr:14425_t:CDS:2 [Funneliformis geosporum]